MNSTKLLFELEDACKNGDLNNVNKLLALGVMDTIDYYDRVFYRLELTDYFLSYEKTLVVPYTKHLKVAIENKHIDVVNRILEIESVRQYINSVIRHENVLMLDIFLVNNNYEGLRLLLTMDKFIKKINFIRSYLYRLFLRSSEFENVMYNNPAIKKILLHSLGTFDDDPVKKIVDDKLRLRLQLENLSIGDRKVYTTISKYF